MHGVILLRPHEEFFRHFRGCAAHLGYRMASLKEGTAYGNCAFVKKKAKIPETP